MKNVDILIIYHNKQRQQRIYYYSFMLTLYMTFSIVNIALRQHFNTLVKKEYLKQYQLIKKIAHATPRRLQSNTKKNTQAVSHKIIALQEIQKNIPEDVFLYSLIFKKKQIVLRGQSPSFNEIQAFITRLKKTGILEKINHANHNEQGKFIIQAIAHDE